MKPIKTVDDLFAHLAKFSKLGAAMDSARRANARPRSAPGTIEMVEVKPRTFAPATRAQLYDLNQGAALRAVFQVAAAMQDDQDDE